MNEARVQSASMMQMSKLAERSIRSRPSLLIVLSCSAQQPSLETREAIGSQKVHF
jgi:hypothetical protein